MKSGDSRGLTGNEKSMVNNLFKDSVICGNVKVCKGKWQFWQPDDTAMVMNGTIYFAEHAVDDFAYGDRHWFMHEMVHIWQEQRGLSLKRRGIYSGMVNYRYPLNDTLDFSKDYHFEQQADILADYYMLEWHQDIRYANMHIIGEKPSDPGELKRIYKDVLSVFLVSPKSSSLLPERYGVWIEDAPRDAINSVKEKVDNFKTTNAIRQHNIERAIRNDIMNRMYW